MENQYQGQYEVLMLPRRQVGTEKEHQRLWKDRNGSEGSSSLRERSLVPDFSV